MSQQNMQDNIVIKSIAVGVCCWLVLIAAVSLAAALLRVTEVCNRSTSVYAQGVPLTSSQLSNCGSCAEVKANSLGCIAKNFSTMFLAYVAGTATLGLNGGFDIIGFFLNLLFSPYLIMFLFWLVFSAMRARVHKS